MAVTNVWSICEQKVQNIAITEYCLFHRGPQDLEQSSS